MATRIVAATAVLLLLLGLAALLSYAWCYVYLDRLAFWSPEQQQELSRLDRQVDKLERAYGFDKLRRRAANPDAEIELPPVLAYTRQQYAAQVAQLEAAVAERDRLLDLLRYSSASLFILGILLFAVVRFMRSAHGSSTTHGTVPDQPESSSD